jgi:putative nucleotidyltransferase with HDIG domain
MSDQAMRERIVDAMPEISLISSEDLRRGVIDAWAAAIEESSFDDIEEVPGEPEVSTTITQVAHQRAVTRMALRMAEEIAELVDGFEADRDVLLAGGLVHDVGKAYEYDPERVKKWRAAPQDAGYPPIRHPAYGVYLALAAGLPEEVAHICASHASEGEHIHRSVEGTIVHYADFAFWDIVSKATTGLTIEQRRKLVLPSDGLRAVPVKPVREEV